MILILAISAASAIESRGDDSDGSSCSIRGGVVEVVAQQTRATSATTQLQLLHRHCLLRTFIRYVMNTPVVVLETNGCFIPLGYEHTVRSKLFLVGVSDWLNMTSYIGCCFVLAHSLIRGI